MKSRVTEPNRPLVVLARIAVLVAAGDWLTKAVASRAIGDDALVYTERLRFAVVHNDAAVFGWSLGAYTWHLNLALTLAAVALMIPVARDLAQIDKSAPRALGLIVGGAVGNLASLVLGPPGVADFISIGAGGQSLLLFNLADVAAYLGLAMMLRTGFLIVAEMRRQARPSVIQVQHWTRVTRRAFTDREVPLQAPLGDRIVPESDLNVPRPESVRRTELIDLEEKADPKVIDIRPHLALPRPEANVQKPEMRGVNERAD